MDSGLYSIIHDICWLFEMERSREQGDGMNNRYVMLVRGGWRAISRIGRWAGVSLLLAVGGVVGIIAFLAVGGMGLALMGTAVGIGPVGWIGICIMFGLSFYGGVCLLRRR